MDTVLLLPAGGKALRMGGVIKELLPLGLQSVGSQALPSPVIVQSFNAGVDSGVDRCLIVTSAIKSAFLMDAIAALNVPFPISFIHQTESAGLGGAVYMARPHVRADDVVLMLMPDTAMRPTNTIARAVQAVRQGSLACATLFRVDQPHHFGVAEVMDDGSVAGFLEKPERPASNWIWTSVAFRFDFFDYVRRSLDAGLTSALDLAAKDGKLVFEFAHGGSYWDIGTYDNYLRALAEFPAEARDQETEMEG